jgi:cytochrome c oxidase assembly factor CtaG
MIGAVLVHYALGVDWIALATFVAAVYTLALLRARHDVPHPAYRWLAFSGGLSALLIAYDTPLDAYDNVSFFAHTAQHLLLLFLVAPLIALGAPIKVALSAAPPWLRDRVLLRCSTAVSFPSLRVPLSPWASLPESRPRSNSHRSSTQP